MSITVGQVYKFFFDTDFDALNGIYKVTNSVDYDTLLSEEVDLMVTLFGPAGLSEAEKDAAIPTIRADIFYRLVNMSGTVTLNVPYQYIVGIPIPDVFEYQKLMLTVDLGPWAEPGTLTSMITVIKQQLLDGFGITQDPQVLAYDAAWLAESDYQAIVAARAVGDPSITNYLSLFNEKEAEVIEKNARIAALEELVRQLDAQLNP